MPYELNVNYDGNKKLVNNGEVRFMIWNIPAQKTCPFATDYCKRFCYAKKAENVYPDCLPCRERNFQESLKDDFVENMIFTIEKKLKGRAYRGKLTLFRIHESGDFYNQAYVDKWMEIIRHFRNVKNLVFMAYTKSLPYFEKYDVKKYKNLAFVASVWDDTKPEMMEIIERRGYRIYTAVDSFENWDGTKCDCQDCANCQKCYKNRYKRIACKIH